MSRSAWSDLCAWSNELPKRKRHPVAQRSECGWSEALCGVVELVTGRERGVGLVRYSRDQAGAERMGGDVSRGSGANSPGVQCLSPSEARCVFFAFFRNVPVLT